MSDESGIENLSGRVGRPVQIQLKCTPGTGAIWYPKTTPTGAALSREDSEPLGPGVGGAVLQKFAFQADSAGTYELVFELKRAWETVVRQEKRVVVRVE
jgi:predicted secreted protein